MQGGSGTDLVAFLDCAVVEGEEQVMVLSKSNRKFDLYLLYKLQKPKTEVREREGKQEGKGPGEL